MAEDYTSDSSEFEEGPTSGSSGFTEEPLWTSNPTAGLSVWQGLLPLLLGGQASRPMEGPEDLLPIATGSISPFMNLYRGQSLDMRPLWARGSGLRALSGRWYTPSREAAEGYAREPGSGELLRQGSPRSGTGTGELLRLGIPQHVAEQYHVNRLSSFIRQYLGIPPGEDSYLLPEWVTKFSTRE